MICSVCGFTNALEARFCTSCGTPLAPAAPPPDAHFLAPRTGLRGGAFILEEPLGAGGFGLTYRARESALGREVAVKEFFPFGSTRKNGAVVAPHGVSREDWTRELNAFREEALTLARFTHPAIVRAYAVWGESGTAYFAMEFLRGQSLQKRLDGGKALPVDEALGIIEGIGDALALVHEAGLLHRDIKPDNILLCEGRSVLIDFGTARAFAADQTTPMTQLLTPGYAPLEQYGRRARFGPYTDVYALAATLYHALCGQAPPSAPDRAGGVELRPLNELNPRVSLQLWRAIEAAMEISVPKRPATVAVWLDSLREAARPVPVPVAPVPVAPVPVPVPPPRPVPATPTIPATSSLPLDSVGVSPRPVPVPRPVSPRPIDTSLPELPAGAKAPLWFWLVLGVIPVLLLGWWFYDPARADLGEFDAHLRPVLKLSSGVQNALASVDRSTPQSTRAGLQVRVVPAQQRVVDALQVLAPQSDEAQFSRDQLLDAETEKLDALQQLARADDESDQHSALNSLNRAADDRAIWQSDYDYLMREHHVR